MATKNKLSSITSQVSGDTLNVRVHGIIGWDVAATEMADMFDNLGDDVQEVVFDIYSPGGNVWEGNYICSRIRELEQHTVANVYVAASMATLIAVSCDEVRMAENGRWLVHNPWTMALGDATELERTVKELRETEDEAVDIYARKTGQDADWIRTLMGEERWVRAPEALDIGFIDTVSSGYSAAAYSDLREQIHAIDDLPPLVQAALVELDEQETDDDAGNDPDAETGSEGDSQDGPDAPDDGSAPETETSAGEAGQQGSDSQSAAEQLEQIQQAYRKMTKERDDAVALAEKRGKELGTAHDEISRKEGVLQDLQRRLRAFGSGLRGTDEDLDRETGQGTMFWEHVAELCEGGMTRDDAITAVRVEYPKLYQAMITEANINKKGK